MPIPVIIDTDPGQDDAVALLLALTSPEIEVLGVTTVAGNVGLDFTTTNARKILDLAGPKASGVPVCAGASHPIKRPLVTAEYVHGETGLDGIELPAPRHPLDPRNGVDFIIDTVRARPEGEVTLVALGPLTNLALALQRAPDLAGRLKRIMLMGGAWAELGNVTPAAEFNIYVDPEAADIVMRAGVDLVIASLDATHQALTSAAWLEEMRGLGTDAGAAVASWCDFFERYDREKYGSEGAPLHDPCTIAWLIDPTLFEGKRVNVAVELEGELTRGMTVVDWWGVTDRPLNALFLTKTRRDGFFDLLTQRIATLG